MYVQYFKFLNESCRNIIKEITTFGSPVISQNNIALFVPEALYEKYNTSFFIEKLFVANDHIWDFNFEINDTIEPMKLIWITKIKNDSRVEIPYDLKLQKAFSFLQPQFLHFMDKPFRNPDVITQVNYILDYHRTQKRQKGIEIFNICDLINFKMAIDDNRYEYENCEFHKIIDRTLNEVMESNTYMMGRFNLNKYLSDSNYYRRTSREIVEYMVYNFQNRFGTITYVESYIMLTKLSNISNIPTFLKSHGTDTEIELEIQEIDDSGRCSEILYELLTKTEVKLNLEFDVKDDWIYTGDGILNEITKPLVSSKIILGGTNNFKFIKNFINWLKLSFGKYTQNIDLELRTDNLIDGDSTFPKIEPYVFNDFYINHLIIDFIELNCKFVRMLKLCKYHKITFFLCTIQNDLNEHIDLIGRHSKETKNIFELLEELDNVGDIQFNLNEDTILMLLGYVASVMTEKELTQFEFQNNITFILNDYVNISKFRRSYVNSVVHQIEAYTESDMRVDFYADFKYLEEENDREEFDFYQ